MASSSSAGTTAHKSHGFGPGKLLLNWLVLVCLTFSTFGVSQIPMPVNYHLAAAICIAIVKLSLVVLFFMHLWWGEGINRIVFLTSFLFLLLLMFFVMADVGTRFTLSNSRIPAASQDRPDDDAHGDAAGDGPVPQGHSDGPGPSSGKAGEQ
jgi:cytochrome c oxidase subunit 4